MKRINPVSVAFVCPSEDSFKTTCEIVKIHEENAKNIIFAASHIENCIAIGITKYFFGEDYEKRKILDDMIISTDFFTFSAKRKTFLTIVRLQEIISGKEYSDLEKLISKVIKYRNMFTHGTAIYSGTKCILHYFEGRKIEKEINDSFLSNIEQEINDCFSIIEDIIMKINLMKA